MINETTSAQLRTLFANNEFVDKFKEIEDFSEMKKLFEDNGVEISDEDLKKGLEIILNSVEAQNGDELTAEQLDEAAGGFVEWLIIGAGCAVVCAVSAYKLRKTLNSMSRSCNAKK